MKKNLQTQVQELTSRNQELELTVSTLSREVLDQKKSYEELFRRLKETHEEEIERLQSAGQVQEYMDARDALVEAQEKLQVFRVGSVLDVLKALWYLRK